MIRRTETLFAALSIACVSAPLLGACTVADTIDQPALLELGDFYDVEMPADDASEPSGQPCSVFGAVAPCLDETSGAFCMYSPEFDLEFGSCVPADEIACIPGDTRRVNVELCGEVEVLCAAWDGVPSWDEAICAEDDGEEGTPLVLRFDAAPITMISADATPAASFDIDARDDASSCVRTDWPSAATPWLAIDLDHSGTIDSGRELFGSGTRLGAGTAANGFIALAAYDTNHDGQVDAADPAYADLLLWRDHDADRLSSPGELEPLSEAGVERLSVDYLSQPRCDARGNCEIERASFSHAGGSGEIVDIHLACQ